MLGCGTVGLSFFPVDYPLHQISGFCHVVMSTPYKKDVCTTENRSVFQNIPGKKERYLE